MRTWILAARPKTLSAALVPIMVSWGIVTSQGHTPQIWTFVLALLASLFIQIGTNLVNDASDFRAGKDTANRLGPMRVTSNGLLSYRSVMTAAGFAFFLAFVCGLPLVFEGGLPILLIGICSILAGYAYTSGPYPLAYNGLGEVFVILFFGFAAVAGLCVINMKFVPTLALIAGAQAGLLCAVLLAINNYRDISEDRQTGKNTLAARFGVGFAKAEIGFLVFSPFVLGIFYTLMEKKNIRAFILPLAIAPLAYKIVSFIRRSEPSTQLNRFIGLSSLLYIIFGVLLTLGLVS